MIVLSIFTKSGTPETGLSPTIDIYTLDGTKVVDGDGMSEVGGGFYKYDFSGYDEDEDYVIVADGGSTLDNRERYKAYSNEVAPVGKIFKIEKNKWKIERNQMIFYDDDGTTPLYTFNLKDARGSPSSKDVYEREPE